MSGTIPAWCHCQRPWRPGGPALESGFIYVKQGCGVNVRWSPHAPEPVGNYCASTYRNNFSSLTGHTCVNVHTRASRPGSACLGAAAANLTAAPGVPVRGPDRDRQMPAELRNSPPGLACHRKARPGGPCGDSRAATAAWP
jgi:hypothetical protein